MDLNSIAAALSLAPAVVESWAKVLESGGVVKITYEVGRMYIESVGVTPEQAAARATEFNTKLDSLKSSLSTESADLDSLSNYVQGVISNVANVQGVFSKSAPGLEKELSELNRIRAQITGYGKEMADAVRSVDEAYSQITKKFDEFAPKYNDFMAKSAAQPQLLDPSADMLKRAKDSLAALDQIRKNKDAMVDSIKREMNEQVKGVYSALDAASRQINDVIAQSRNSIEQGLRQLEDSSKAGRAMLKEAQNISGEGMQMLKKLEQDRAQFNDRYAKISKEMKDTYSLFQEKYSALSEKTDEMISKYGDAGELSKTLAELKAKSDQAKTDIASLKGQLETLQREATALGTLKGTPQDKRESMLDALVKKEAGVKQKASATKSSVQSADQELGKKVKNRGGKSGSAK
jgi:ABC-type transporter Mla subunit MlaD